MGHNESSGKRKIHGLSALLKKFERSYTSNIKAYPKYLERKEVSTPKTSRKQEIVKLMTEINQIETKRTIQRINKTKSWFFERINKIDKPIAELTKGPRGSITINNIQMEMEA